MTPTVAVRVGLPVHLRRLAGAGSEVTVEVASPPTVAGALDALEVAHPQLVGTIRDRVSGARRPLVRYFACGEDFSHVPPETALPPAVVDGAEPLLVVGAMAGG